MDDNFGAALAALSIARSRGYFGGPHHKDPWLMEPRTVASASLKSYNSASTLTTGDTTAFFTGLTSYGIQDNTDWTSDTYKTLYSHTGRGLIFGIVACTAGGAETTTFEITIDGKLHTVTVTNANGERAALLAGGAGFNGGTEFTTATIWQQQGTALDAGLTTQQTGNAVILPVKWLVNAGVPALRYDSSCLIRAKHSASISNSVATSYSAVIARKGIAA
jgi:hypothetical protein